MIHIIRCTSKGGGRIQFHIFQFYYAHSLLTTANYKSYTTLISCTYPLYTGPALDIRTPSVIISRVVCVFCLQYVIRILKRRHAEKALLALSVAPVAKLPNKKDQMLCAAFFSL